MERTYRRLHESYEARKRGEKELMDNTRKEFNSYFSLCALALARSCITRHASA